MQRIKIIITVVVLSCCVGLEAATAPRKSKRKKPVYNHEVYFQAGGGISTLTFPVNGGKKSMGFGGGGGLGYTYYFKPNLGIGSGVGMSLFNSKITLTDYEDVLTDLNDGSADPTIDGSDDFDLYTTFKQWTEKQRLTTVTIPIMATWRTGDVEQRFYVSAGLKINLPITASYRVNDGEVSKAGYYTQLDNWARTQGFMGFGDYKNIQTKGDLSLKMMYSVALEGGMQWQLKSNIFVYTGIYVDYALNKSEIAKTNFTSWDNEHPTEFKPNSLLASNQSGGKAFADKVGALAAGVTVRLSYGIAAQRSAKKSKAEERKLLLAEQAAEKARRDAAKKQKQPAQHKTVEDVGTLTPDQLQEQEARFRQQANEQEKKAYEEAIREVEQSFEGYSLDQVEPSQEAKAALDAKLQILNRYPFMRLVVEGHTDDLGSHSTNMRMGLTRAEAAKSYLVERGIDPKRITCVSKAESEPVVPNIDEESRTTNRRIVLRVVQQ